MPGLTTGGKAINHEYRIAKMHVNVDFEKQIKKYSFTQKFEDEKTFDEQIIQLDRIIEYLVSKTEDLDAYVKSFDNQQGTNSLFLAAEFNDVKVCELLLEKGASPTTSLGETLLCTIPNEYGITPIIYFLYHTQALDNSKELRKQFISKFVKAGANLNQGSILGSANQVIKMLEYYEKQKK